MTEAVWWLVQNSVAVAVLAAVIWLVCRLLRNRPAVQHVLWLVVLIKFMTPPIVSWPWSAGEIGGRLAQLVTPAESEVASFPPETVRSRHSASANPVDEESRSSATAPAPVVADVPPDFERTTGPAETITSPESAVAPPSPPARETATRFAASILFGLWLFGCATALAVQSRRIARHAAIVRKGTRPPPALVHEIAGVAASLGVRPVPALLVRRIATPFLWCLGRPRLIWPEALGSDANVERCRTIIAHELAHVKRRDHWVAWLELAAGCLWWWNPLFWYVRRQLSETADLACDARALSLMPGADRRVYAETFLELSRLASQRQAPAPALGVSTGDRRTIERRLAMILNEHVKSSTPAAAVAAVVLFAGLVLPGFPLYQADGMGMLAAENGDSTPATVPAEPTPEKLDAVTQGRLVTGETSGALAAGQPQQSANALLRRTGRFATGMTGNDTRIAWSADGRLLAVANGNPTRIMQRTGTSRVKDDWKPLVHFLDAETGETVVALRLSTDEEEAVLAATERVSHFEVTALAFSPDGKVLAVGTSIGQVKLFDVRTGQLVRLLDDEQAKLADQKTPENWQSLGRAMGSVTSLAFSPDGSLLAVSGDSFADFSGRFDGLERLGFRATGPGRLKLWDVQTGALKHDLEGHNDHAYAVAFSPDGRWLASAGRWHKEGDALGNGVILWNPHTGVQVHRLIRTTANAGARAMMFSPDSKLLAIGTQRFGEGASTGGVSLVHVSTGIVEWLQTVPGWAKPVAFAPDGKSVAVLCGGRSIRFLETEAGRVVDEIQAADSPQGRRWVDFMITPQGEKLAIGCVDSERRGSVEVWDLRGLSAAFHSAPAAAAGAEAAKHAAGNEEHEPLVVQLYSTRDGDLADIRVAGNSIGARVERVNSAVRAKAADGLAEELVRFEAHARLRLSVVQQVVAAVRRAGVNKLKIAVLPLPRGAGDAEDDPDRQDRDQPASNRLNTSPELRR
jgi:beta-lactamase regulating signal transducer with metallopeptidase domain/WD40 repeat protein